MFLSDWGAALESHSLAHTIVRCHHSSEKWRALKPEDAADSHEVGRVTQVLWAHHKLIYGAFDHYSCRHSSSTATKSSDPRNLAIVDIFNIKFNAFVEFVRDVQLPSAEFPSSRFETCYAVVDSNVQEREKLSLFDRHNKVRALCRHEWLQVLVRIAIARYVPNDKKGNPLGDVSDAVEKLFDEHLKPHLPIDALQSSNHFRTTMCYNEKMETILRKHHASMVALYDRYARMVHNPGGELQDRKLLSIDEWLLFTKHLELTGEDCLHATVHDVKQIFLWSRIRTCPTHSDADEIRLRHLLFEDFMEALVRLACIMALPSDDEIAESGAADAGEFLLVLASEQPVTLAHFVEERRAHWSEAPKQAPWRCVDHLLAYIVRVVELNLSGGERDINDGVVSAEEAEAFAERRIKGKELNIGRRGGAVSSESIAEKLATVQARVQAAIRAVRAFDRMSDRQLAVLANNMRSAMWKKGEYVFEQGNEGDAFYVIISGYAKVLRDDSPDAEEHHLQEEDDEVTVLARLGEGACFGERALLRSEKRFASILVASDELHVKMMTRAEFEALFSDMQKLMRDEYG